MTFTRISVIKCISFRQLAPLNNFRSTGVVVSIKISVTSAEKLSITVDEALIMWCSRRGPLRHRVMHPAILPKTLVLVSMLSMATNRWKPVVSLSFVGLNDIVSNPLISNLVLTPISASVVAYKDVPVNDTLGEAA